MNKHGYGCSLELVGKGVRFGRGSSVILYRWSPDFGGFCTMKKIGSMDLSGEYGSLIGGASKGVAAKHKSHDGGVLYRSSRWRQSWSFRAQY